MPIKNRITNKPIPFNIVPKTNVVRLNPLDVDEIAIKINIAIKSWIIKKPIEIFNVDLGKIEPYGERKVKKELADKLLKQKYFEEVKTGGI